MGLSSRAVPVSMLAFVSLTMTAADVASAAMPSWTQFQGNAEHTGHVATTLNASSLTQIWSLSAADLGSSWLVAGVATDSGHVYLTTQQNNTDFAVFALDKTSGGVTWQHGLVPSGPFGVSAPTVGNGMVYVQQSGESGSPSITPPTLQGLNAATGATVFSTVYAGQWTSTQGVTYSGSQVFIPAGYYGGLSGFNATTGQAQWFTQTAQQDSWNAAVDANNAYVYMGWGSASPGPYTATLYIFNRTTGAVSTILNPADVGAKMKDTVYLGAQHDAIVRASEATGMSLVSFDLAANNIRWRATGHYLNAVAIDDNIVFAETASTLNLLDEATGNLLNQWLAPGGQTLAGNLVLTDNLIFVQTTLGTYALDRTTMDTVWSTNLTGNLALGDDVLIINNDSTIAAFAVPVPEPMTAGLLLAAPVVAWLRRRK